jgi:hypothetical protein
MSGFPPLSINNPLRSISKKTILVRVVVATTFRRHIRFFEHIVEHTILARTPQVFATTLLFTLALIDKIVNTATVAFDYVPNYTLVTSHGLQLNSGQTRRCEDPHVVCQTLIHIVQLPFKYHNTITCLRSTKSQTTPSLLHTCADQHINFFPVCTVLLAAQRIAAFPFMTSSLDSTVPSRSHTTFVTVTITTRLMVRRQAGLWTPEVPVPIWTPSPLPSWAEPVQSSWAAPVASSWTTPAESSWIQPAQSSWVQPVQSSWSEPAMPSWTPSSPTLTTSTANPGIVRAHRDRFGSIAWTVVGAILALCLMVCIFWAWRVHRRGGKPFDFTGCCTGARRGTDAAPANRSAPVPLSGAGKHYNKRPVANQPPMPMAPPTRPASVHQV